MMKTIKAFQTLFLFSLMLIGCNSNTNKTEAVVNATQPASSTVNNVEPQVGDWLPNNLVCMVNNAYMGREQIEVPFEGKIYYGCCEMCEKQIPIDESVRYAVDPFTSAKVDKALAYIVLVGARGEVAYFENEKNYQDFLEQYKM